jgi:aminopeptidase N
MTRHLKHYKGEYEYECLTKKKGLVMFDMLRKSVGDKKFFAGLKKYYKNAQFTVATPETLIGAFEKTGLDVRGFFDSFLNGKAIL